MKYNYTDIQTFIANATGVEVGEIHSKRLHRARFYAITQYYADNDQMLRKDEGFIKWVDATFKSFKRMFLQKTDVSSFLFTENAKLWMDRNNGRVDEAELTITIP